MCIGIVSEFGVPMPDDDTLKRCWESNSDGAGYAYLTDANNWCIKKGFMKWVDFKESFDAEKFVAEHTVVMHFRIGTSGRCPHKAGEFGKGEMCTHPFPISDKQDMLESLRLNTKTLVLHNGVVGHGVGFLSDTMVSIRDHIFVLWKYAKDDPKVMEILEELLDCGARYKGSRWFIADGVNYAMLGGWELDKDTKLWYSHDGYKAVQSWSYNYGSGTAGAYPYDADGYGDHWDTRNQMGNVNGAMTTVPCVTISTQEAYEFHEGGSWSWKKWDANSRIILLDDATKETTPDVSSAVGIREVYSPSGDHIIALVDSHGIVVWDDVIDVKAEEEDIKGDEPFECLQCGADELTYGQLDDGCCPFCSAILVPSLAIAVESSTKCPACGERHHLAESTFDVGDTECFRCGAVFVNTIQGKDSIVTWNEDTKVAHDTLIKDAAENS
jgi:hypothetical protein